MLKKILIVLGIIILLIGGALTYAFMNASSLVTSYKPQLERMVSEALGSKVTVNEITVTVFPRAEVGLKNLTVQGEGAEKLGLEELGLQVQLGALLQRQLNVSALVLRRPDILLIKDGSGVRVAGLPARHPEDPKAKAPRKPAPASEPEKSPAEPGAAPLDVSLEKVEIEDGTVTFRDTTAKETYEIKALNLTAAVVLDGAEIRVPSATMTAQLLGQIPVKIQINDIVKAGNAVSVPSGELTLINDSIGFSADYDLATQKGRFHVKSSGIKLGIIERVKSQLPEAARAMSLSGEIAPDIKGVMDPDPSVNGSVALKDLGAAIQQWVVTEGNGTIIIDGSPAAANLACKELRFALNGSPMTFNGTLRYSPEKLGTKDLVLTGLGGKVNAQATVGLIGAQSFTSNFALAGLKLNEIFGVMGTPTTQQNIFGTLSDIRGQVAGSLGPSLLQSLNGQTTMSVSDVTLKNFNLLAKTLGAVKDLPFMKGSLLDAVPEGERKAIESPDTVISSITGTANLGGGAIETRDLRAQSDLFLLTAVGRVGFDQSMDLDATLILSKGLSAALVDKVKELKALTNNEGLIALPVTLKGHLPNVMVTPNIRELLKGSAGKMLEEKAGELLNRALGGKKGGEKRGLFGF